MTTTITVETHDWPVEVKAQEYFEHATGSHYSKRVEIVPPNSSHTCHVTQTMRVTFTELPLPSAPAAQQAA
jgi:hypothetical protein